VLLYCNISGLRTGCRLPTLAHQG